MNKIPTKKSGFNPNWQIKTLNEVCNRISAVGDKPYDCTTEKTEENQIPIFSNVNSSDYEASFNYIS